MWWPSLKIHLRPSTHDRLFVLFFCTLSVPPIRLYRSSRYYYWWSPLQLIPFYWTTLYRASAAAASITISNRTTWPWFIHLLCHLRTNLLGLLTEELVYIFTRRETRSRWQVEGHSHFLLLDSFAHHERDLSAMYPQDSSKLQKKSVFTREWNSFNRWVEQ